MSEITLADVELMLKTIAATALRNEKYFSELDAAAGDADFGVSLAAGFKIIEQDFDKLDRSSISSLLLRTSMVITAASLPITGADQILPIILKTAAPTSKTTTHRA